MAYSRYRKRRGARRYGRAKRRTGRSKRSRVVGRKRLRRQIINTASKKYRDTLISSTEGTLPANSIAPLYSGLNVFAFCPTFRDRAALDEQQEIARHSANVFYKGYKELLSLRTSQPIVWRRIVFWTYDTWFSLVPWRLDRSNTGDPPETYYARRIDHKAFFGSDSGLRNMMFRGSLGIDYTSEGVVHTPVDRKRNRVVYDKSFNITPNYDASTDEFGKMIQKKLWHPANRTIWYDDVEQGSSVTSQSGWSSPSPLSAGNMFVVDLISNGEQQLDPSTQLGTFTASGVEYWHES